MAKKKYVREPMTSSAKGSSGGGAKSQPSPSSKATEQSKPGVESMWGSLFGGIKKIGGLEWLALAAVFVVFFTCFRWGLHLRAVDALAHTRLLAWFQQWQTDSDQLVLERLKQNHAGGIFSEALALGEKGSYGSQFGLASWLVALPATLFPSSVGIPLMFTLVAGFNAALVTVALRALARTLSFGGAVLAAIALLQPWPTAMAHSIYWFMGIKILPAVVLALLFAWGKDSLKQTYVAVSIFTALACLSGYEYITLVVALPLAVCTYYVVLRDYSWSDALRRLGVTLGASITGFASALVVHLAQLSAHLHGVSAGLHLLLERVAVRTGSGTVVLASGTPADVQKLVADALASNPKDVLGLYLSMPILGDPGDFGLLRLVNVATLILVVIVALVLGYRVIQRSELESRHQAAGIAWLVALLGPVGWILLARPHSYIHSFINFDLWYVSVIPLGLALLWMPIRDGSKSLKVQKIPLSICAVVVLSVLIFFVYSGLTRR
ncbi:unannotated protein [freshwater metagenome]|uniref:Unannotated protein n=1 Tax=freshwater metagenome TaxID=449393 RepID=A0A6J7D1J7_9ZZZZ|nr:hypothetical protein [Actinomycetota bacterium]